MSSQSDKKVPKFLEPVLQKIKSVVDTVTQLLPVKALINFLDQAGPDRAASLAYYSFLSFFPMVIAAVSTLGLVGFSSTVMTSLKEVVQETVPEELFTLISTVVDNFTASSGLALVVSTLVLIWTASNYVAAFGRAADRLSGYQSRPVYLSRPRMYIITLLFLVLIVVVVILVVVTSDLSASFISFLNLDMPAVVRTLQLLRWPLVLAIALGAIALLYYLTPSNPKFFEQDGQKPKKDRAFLPGAAVAVLIVSIISIGFSLYFSNFGRYEVVYGTLASIIITLLWFWLINVALLYGFQFNLDYQERSKN